MSTTTDVLIEFKNQLITFFDELIAQFPAEGDLVVLRLFIANQIPIKDAMDSFNYKINTEDQKLRKMIKARNEAYFLDNNPFDNISKDKVSHFKKLWLSGSLDTEDKRIIWQWVDSFIFLGDKYLKAANGK